MTELLPHKELKTEARKTLREKYGFNDKEIIEEYSYILKNKVKVRIDIVGKSNNKFIAVECGNTSKLKQSALIEEFGKENVLLLPYSENILKSYYYEELKPRKDRIMLLKSVYNEYIYEKLKDDKDFSLLKYSTEDEHYFYVGKKTGIWMAFPTKKSVAIGKNLQFEINFTLHLTKDNLFEIAINAETNPSVKQFLDLTENTKERIIEELRKLPSGFETQDGFKYKTPSHRGPPLPRNWESTEPISCNQMNIDKLNEMESRLSWYLRDGGGKDFEEYPAFILAKIIVRKEELSKVMMGLKQLYLLSFKFRTKEQEKVTHDSKELYQKKMKSYELGFDTESTDEDYQRWEDALKRIEQENSTKSGLN